MVMKNELESRGFTDDKLLKTIEEIEREKEEKLLNLIVEIIVQATLKECYEKGDQVSAV